MNLDKKYINFGSYPEEKVEDLELINVLNSKLTGLPSSQNLNGWIDFKYYKKGIVTPFMWYKDITYQDEKYRAIYFNSIRYPATNEYDFTYEDEIRIYPDYKRNTVHWFKFKPIKWRVLDESDDQLLLISEEVLDAMEFYNNEKEIRVINDIEVYPNNWEYSNIRKWLNDYFYNLAFNEEEKSLIIDSLVNNNNTMCNLGCKFYDIQNNTVDKVYLLSRKESLIYFNNNEFYGEEKLAHATSYALYNMCLKSKKNNHTDWLLRSPNIDNYGSGNVLLYVDENGSVLDFTRCDSIEGIRPVINIKK